MVNSNIPHQLIAILGNTIGAVDETSKVNHYNADRYIDAQNHHILPPDFGICTFIFAVEIA